MSEPFLSEIKIFGFNFAPRGWATCDGQILPIAQNQSLYSLLGTTYGGDGRTTFGLPDLRGRVPLHMGSGFPLGVKGGEAAHSLSIAETPQHTHELRGVAEAGNSPIPAANMPASSPNQLYRGPAGAGASMTPATVANAGGSQAHSNMQPYLSVTFCIALQGLFPSRN